MTETKNVKTSSSHDLAVWIAQLLDKKGGRGIFILDVREQSSITDFMIIVSGTSSRQMETLIEAPCLELKRTGHPPTAVEGGDTTWIVADFGDVILHVMDEATRQKYSLEELWASAPRVEWEQSAGKASLLSVAGP